MRFFWWKPHVWQKCGSRDMGSNGVQKWTFSTISRKVFICFLSDVSCFFLILSVHSNSRSIFVFDIQIQSSLFGWSCPSGRSVFRGQSLCHSFCHWCWAGSDRTLQFSTPVELKPEKVCVCVRKSYRERFSSFLRFFAWTCAMIKLRE